MYAVLAGYPNRVFNWQIILESTEKNKVSKKKKKQMENLFIDVIVMVLLPQ